MLSPNGGASSAPLQLLVLLMLNEAAYTSEKSAGAATPGAALGAALGAGGEEGLPPHGQNPRGEFCFGGSYHLRDCLLSHPSERDISTAMPFTMPARRTFSTKVELAVALAQFVSEQSSASIGDHGYFAVAFSGGSLPSILAEGLQSIQIDVTKWKVFFADERCVPLDNPESNFKAVQEQCLSKVLNIISTLLAPQTSLFCSSFN
eukprot:gene3323-6007_t